MTEVHRKWDPLVALGQCLGQGVCVDWELGLRNTARQV